MFKSYVRKNEEITFEDLGFFYGDFMKLKVCTFNDDTEILLSDLNKNTKSVSSVIAWVPAYSRR